ncbi:protein imuA [Phenylobacterium hankyongense]|uniref:Protein imuA n=1 Tax=Phenylobacterium hankyongense TaxID=1813876 RepID=A0A328AVT8_9CAUL|nr:protein imuA [Phenylobacterium hankyongense]RAK59200.1 protein imuA [Phenylobacterium hankyongense]
MSDFRAGRLAAMRAKIAAIEAGGRADSESLPFGDPAIDHLLPGGGLPLGRWHEIGGAGLETETAAAPAAFTALMAAPLARRGEAVWVLRRDDLWAPGLAGLGFPVERLIQVCARDEAEALSVMEDALSTIGVSAVFGEVEDVDLTAGRRLQLACEKQGSTGFVIRRRPFGGKARREAGGSAAATRWRVASAPSEPPAGEFGLGAPRFEVTLERCRGGRTGTWLFEAADAYFAEARDGTHPLRLVADLGDRQLAPAQPLRLAG